MMPIAIMGMSTVKRAMMSISRFAARAVKRYRKMNPTIQIAGMSTVKRATRKRTRLAIVVGMRYPGMMPYTPITGATVKGAIPKKGKTRRNGTWGISPPHKFIPKSNPAASSGWNWKQALAPIMGA